jgi:uncharacterized membrane protein
VLVAIVLMATLLSLLSVQKYRSYDDARFDLGIMVQAVDNTAHGRFLEVTDVDGRQVSRLGAHVDPIIAVFAVPWLIWPSPAVLLIGQAIIVCLAAWPAYRLGLRILGDSRAALAGALALLFYPSLGYAVLNEFHPVTLAIPLLLFAFLYLDEGRLLVAAPFLVLAALCKEEVPLVIAFMGLYFAWRRRSWRPLLITVAAGLYFLVVVRVVMPHYRVGGSPFVGRYSAYGSSLGQIARNLVLHPGATMRGLATRVNARYLWQLLWPFGLAPLLSPLTTLIALPEYVLNGLSSVSYQHRATNHYVSAEVPLLFAGALFGLARLAGWLGWLRRARTRPVQPPAPPLTQPAQSPAESPERAPTQLTEHTPGRSPARTLAILAGLLLCAALVGNYVLGPLPFGLPGAKASPGRYAMTAHAAVIERAIRLVPPGAIVSAQNRIGSHLSARRVVYLFPYVGNARYVIVDATGFEPHSRIRAVALALVRDSRYVLLFSHDGVTVYRRTAT